MHYNLLASVAVSCFTPALVGVLSLLAGQGREMSREVFPGLGIDYIDTADRIMSAVHIDQLKLSGDSQNNTSRTTATDIPSESEKDPERDGEVRPWMLAPTDAYNKAQLTATAWFLKSLSTSLLREYDYLDTPHPVFYWQATLTDAQGDQVVQHPGIAWANPADGGTVSGAPVSSKQDVKYTTQKDAVAELIAISQPSTAPNIAYLKNYVYEQHAGRRSFIYHVEAGVNYLKNPTEFPHLAPTHILTPHARALGRKPEQEHWDGGNEFPSHGTCTASKALGQQYGAAKNAKLVVVAMADFTQGEVTAAFEEIAKDVRMRGAERRKHSVVTMSVNLDRYDGRRKESYELLRTAMREVMELDVPIVVPAGNNGRMPGRRRIDTVPAVFAGLDRSFPLIVVGSVNSAGVGSPFSQLGGTINAVGEDVTCATAGGAEGPVTELEGTSYAAPLVAGEIANLLAYDNVPIDTSDGKLVENMRDYLETSEAAGWTRSGGLRVLWNGVTEADNPKVPKLRCYGLAGGRYVNRETLRGIIVNEFCPVAAQRGDATPTSYKYRHGTMDEVLISVTHNNPDWKPHDKGTCAGYLLGEITNGCDGQDALGNPANYKGGGELALDDFTYYIEPQVLMRPPAGLGLGGGCEWDSVDGNGRALFSIWGRGWATDDFGAALREKLTPYGADDWVFNYGVEEEDGREWTATFRTGVGQKRRVEGAAKAAGAPPSIKCRGN